MNKTIITLDGHSGCGKSTLAKLLAKELNFLYIDTGAMYRAISLFFLESNQILKNGLFLHISERDGYQHMYLERTDGRFTVPVTSGQWEVKEIVHVDEKNETIFFMSNKKSVLEKHLYSVRFDGTALKLLTPEPGTHSVSMNPNGKTFIDTSQMDEKPIAPPTKTEGKKRDGLYILIIILLLIGGGYMGYMISEKNKDLNECSIESADLENELANLNEMMYDTGLDMGDDVQQNLKNMLIMYDRMESDNQGMNDSIMAQKEKINTLLTELEDAKGDKRYYMSKVYYTNVY